MPALIKSSWVIVGGPEAVGGRGLGEAGPFRLPHLCTESLCRSQVDDEWAQGSSGGVKGSEMASAQVVNCPALG